MSPDTESVPYVLLLTNDADGLTGFPGTLLPNGRLLVRSLPVERLDGICPGEVVVIPPPGSQEPVQRVRPTGTRARRSSERAPTVTAVITLSRPVAHIPIPEEAATPAAFDKLMSENDGDIVAALGAAGMKITSLRSADAARGADARQRDAGATCTAPEVQIGLEASMSLCDWLGIFCP